MNDQAQNLRDLVKKQPAGRSASRIITVTSGKGGVGKTFFSVNLAIALSRRGLRVLIIDADFGLANIDIMLGAVAKYNFSHVLSGEKEISEIIQEGYEGVKFISGGSGMYDLLNLGEKELSTLIEGLVGLDGEADILIFDTGAGINDHIVQLVAASTDVILVSTPEPTSLVDAYAMIKTLAVEAGLKSLRLVMNRAESVRGAQNATDSLMSVVAKNIGIEVLPLGYISYDGDISRSIQSYTPLLIKYPRSIATKNIISIAGSLMGTTPSPGEGSSGFSRLFSRLVR